MALALVALTSTPSDVVWPKADSEISEREGWVRGSVEPSLHGPRYVMDAMTRGVLSVHRMVGKDDNGWTADDGWTISTILGQRITYGARVFATCMAAMKVAEKMGAEDPAWVEWTECRAKLSDDHREKLRTLFEGAEVAGEIMRTLSFVNR